MTFDTTTTDYHFLVELRRNTQVVFTHWLTVDSSNRTPNVFNFVSQSSVAVVNSAAKWPVWRANLPTLPVKSSNKQNAEWWKEKKVKKQPQKSKLDSHWQSNLAFLTTSITSTRKEIEKGNETWLDYLFCPVVLYAVPYFLSLNGHSQCFSFFVVYSSLHRCRRWNTHRQSSNMPTLWVPGLATDYDDWLIDCPKRRETVLLSIVGVHWRLWSLSKLLARTVIDCLLIWKKCPFTNFFVCLCLLNFAVFYVQLK